MSLGIDKPFRIENHELVINHDAIRGMEPFATIVRRLRKTKGDHDGRKKVINFGELMYIYFMADYNAYHRGLDDKEKTKKAKEDAGLPDDWLPDSVVLQGIEKYKEIIDMYIPSARILISLEQGLALTALAVDSYRTQMAQLMEIVNNKLTELADDPEAIMTLMETNNLIRSNIKEIMSIGKDLPKTVDGIKSLQEQVRKEEGVAKELAGGRKKKRREDPNQ